MASSHSQVLPLGQTHTNSAGSSGLRLWPLEFEEAFECAAGFADC